MGIYVNILLFLLQANMWFYLQYYILQFLFTSICLQALPFGPHSLNACFVDIMVLSGCKWRLMIFKKKVDLMIFKEISFFKHWPLNILSTSATVQRGKMRKKTPPKNIFTTFSGESHYEPCNFAETSLKL